jgi:hypothetical protein
VEQLTERHLETAERNRGIALTHVTAQPVTIQTLPRGWSAVIAFYAAVHYVNAYLWEMRRYAPPDHGSRNQIMTRDSVLNQGRFQYRRLLDAGFRARYVPNFRLSEQDAHRLIDIDLERVRETVRGALGLPRSM